ncbi:probable UDP-sugar transporter protein SLC35A4 [Tachysurus fulvidraco]|uniref:probable UDP-sugar transporter protein SLC35A4 n=1 Tax=Tachysurus fulvidraco TaxID=1234273 RepID=UPI000F4FB932|nr:probable UDP-sugar transporter protein SLC35A4 [Tachysurus fulvidraco]
MIIIKNVGSSDIQPPHTKRWLSGSRWLFLLIVSVFIYGSHAPLIALTKSDGRVPFSPSSCVVLIELCKLLISLSALFASGDIHTIKVSVSWTAVVPYALPALLYAFNNNLVVFMQAYMDPSSFQVLSNLKIASTALLYTSCLRKRLRRAQWAAMALLMVAGALHSYSSLDWEIPDKRVENARDGLHITAWGLLLILLYCFVSGLAAVYTEKVLKSQRLPLSLQNLFLYIFGVGINLMSHFYSTGTEQTFLDGYSALVWVIIAGQAANGLLMSVIMKHGTGITRLFIISSAMLVNSVLSWWLLGLQLTPFFFLPLLLIAVAVYFYYR